MRFSITGSTVTTATRSRSNSRELNEDFPRCVHRAETKKAEQILVGFVDSSRDLDSGDLLEPGSLAGLRDALFGKLVCRGADRLSCFGLEDVGGVVFYSYQLGLDLGALGALP
jgi:hypothetical protein